MTLDPGRVQDIFLEALEQSTLAARTAVLDSTCAGDDELRRRVDALLLAHDRPDRLLDRPLFVPASRGATIHARPADLGEDSRSTRSDPESVA